MKTITTLLFCFTVLASIHAEAAKRPNILFILADDAGYADFGFQGSKLIHTPHLDKLASQGMKFTQAYVSAAVCGPSRAGILTGKYQQRFGFEENNVPGLMSASGLTGSEMGLPLEEKTLGNYLQDLGYTTGLIGKWHQGQADKFHPMHRGFDEFYGFRGGARSYFELKKAEANKQPEKKLERGFAQYQESPKYLTDAFADEAIAFIDRHQDKPFFLFLSFNAVHAPMHTQSEDLQKYPSLAGKRKQVAAMTTSMDRAIGRVLAQLDTANLTQDTIVVFTNDNGGPTDSNASNNYPLSGTKANHLEGGIRVPFIMRWPEVIKPNTAYSHAISTLDLLPTFASAAGFDFSKERGIDGVDLKPFIMRNKTSAPHEYLYWKKESRGAIRNDDWKLLRFPDRPAELYNLSTDQSETINLANKHPEIVARLYKKLFEWELGLERPRWQLIRATEGKAMQRMDKYRIKGIP